MSRTWSAPIDRHASGEVSLLRREEIENLGTELEDRPELGVEFADAFAQMWPTRRARLRTALDTGDPIAARDALASIRVSAMMVGADQLEGSATELLEAVGRSDFDQARAALAELDAVGEATIAELARGVRTA